MIFRNLDSDGDWSFGSGVQSYAYGERAIQLNIQTALFTFLNEIFWQLDFGVDWWNLCGGKNPAAQANIILQTRKTIINCEGVVRINSVDVTTDSRSRNLRLSYNIDTTFTRNLRNSISIPTNA